MSTVSVVAADVEFVAPVYNVKMTLSSRFANVLRMLPFVCLSDELRREVHLLRKRMPPTMAGNLPAAGGIRADAPNTQTKLICHQKMFQNVYKKEGRRNRSGGDFSDDSAAEIQRPK